MTLSHALIAFFQDKLLQTALFVLLADLLFGVLAAFKLGTFRLSYLADIGRNDILFKLLPWAGLYVGAKFAGHQQIVIPGLDLGDIAGGYYALNVASWAGSLLNSLTELGVPTAAQQRAAMRAKVASALPLPAWIAAPENSSPPKD